MSEVNPYNCSSPGNLFVGYEELRTSILRGLRNGKSYSLLGGRRCGKTSLLLKLREDLRVQGIDSHRVLPRFFDTQALKLHSPFDFFSHLYALTVEGLPVEPWDTPPARQHYQEFLSRLDKARAQLEKAYGPKWVVVLLIDELDSAPAHLPDDECFQNLRNLLTASPYRSHFRVVASGCSGMGQLIDSSSPLNNLDPEYTRILTLAETRQLIAAGFPHGLEAPVAAELLTRTGQHPYALQGLLGILWEERDAVTAQQVQKAARRFTRDRMDTFKTWLRDIREDGHACFAVLASTPEGSLGEKELRLRITRGLSVSEGLRTLSYHGLIDEEADPQPRIAGTIFRDWFLDSSPELPAMTAPTRDQVFISYSHKDKTWLDRLETHLKPRIRNGKVNVWNDKRLKAGDEWRKEIDEALARAKVAVLLVSPDFLASDFIAKNELPPLLEAAKQGGVKILWVPVKTSAFREANLGQYQGVLDPAKPLSKRHHAYVDDAMEEICNAISQAFSAA